MGLALNAVDDTAAAASVQLKACSLILRDSVGNPPQGGSSVNVSISNTIQQQPGLVIRLSPEHEAKVKSYHAGIDAKTIEHDPRHARLLNDPQTAQQRVMDEDEPADAEE